jgi:hypothetical protein
MKQVMMVVASVVAVAVMVFGVMYAMRLFSNATTPLTLSTPKPGVTCAAMVTGDGVALSCWKD